MASNPYSRFASTQLILRDQLAIDRTILANERTFLAYVRTALAFALTGAGCIRFFDNPIIHALGVFLIIAGLTISVIGTWRTLAMSRNMDIIDKTEQSAIQDTLRGEN